MVLTDRSGEESRDSEVVGRPATGDYVPLGEGQRSPPCRRPEWVVPKGDHIADPVIRQPQQRVKGANTPQHLCGVVLGHDDAVELRAYEQGRDGHVVLLECWFQEAPFRPATEPRLASRPVVTGKSPG
jgi:hypothetical protein